MAGAYQREYALMIRIGLAAALAGNIVALPEHRAIVSDRPRANYQRAVALRNALLAKQPDPAFGGDPIFRVLRPPEKE